MIMKIKSRRLDTELEVEVYQKEDVLIIRHTSLENIFWGLPDAQRPEMTVDTVDLAKNPGIPPMFAVKCKLKDPASGSVFEQFGEMLCSNWQIASKITRDFPLTMCKNQAFDRAFVRYLQLDISGKAIAMYSDSEIEIPRDMLGYDVNPEADPAPVEPTDNGYAADPVPAGAASNGYTADPVPAGAADNGLVAEPIGPAANNGYATAPISPEPVGSNGPEAGPVPAEPEGAAFLAGPAPVKQGQNASIPDTIGLDFLPEADVQPQTPIPGTQPVPDCLGGSPETGNEADIWSGMNVDETMAAYGYEQPLPFGDSDDSLMPAAPSPFPWGAQAAGGNATAAPMPDLLQMPEYTMDPVQGTAAAGNNAGGDTLSVYEAGFDFALGKTAVTTSAGVVYYDPFTSTWETREFDLSAVDLDDLYKQTSALLRKDLKDYNGPALP